MLEDPLASCFEHGDAFAPGEHVEGVGLQGRLPERIIMIIRYKIMVAALPNDLMRINQVFRIGVPGVCWKLLRRKLASEAGGLPESRLSSH